MNLELQILRLLNEKPHTAAALQGAIEGLESAGAEAMVARIWWRELVCVSRPFEFGTLSHAYELTDAGKKHLAALEIIERRDKEMNT